MKKIIAAGVPLMLPLFAAAAKFGEILNTVKSLVDSIIPLFMVVAIAVFLWGIVKYITASGDEEKAKSARGYIIYGLIGLFVMVAFWGIIKIVAETFDVETGGQIILPTIKTQ